MYVQRLIGNAPFGVYALHILDDTAFVVERLAVLLERTAVFEDDLKPFVEIRQLLQSVAERRIVEFQSLEYLIVGIEHDLGPAPFGVAYTGERTLRDASVEAHLVQLAVLRDLDVEPLGKRVDARYAHAVQTSRKFVSAAAEFASRVQLGQYDFDRGLALFLDYADGDTSAVVGDGHRARFEDLDLDRIAVSRHRLVDRVVDDFEYEMMQSSFVRGTDVHTRSFADGLQSFEHLDIALGIAVLFGHFYLRCPHARTRICARSHKIIIF